MNSTKALLAMQRITFTRQDDMNVLSAYIVRTSTGDYQLVVADRMEDLLGEVGFYTVSEENGHLKMADFIGLCKEVGVELDYTQFLESRGFKVMARYQPCVMATAV